jgi:ATP-dependent DNA helicase
MNNGADTEGLLNKQSIVSSLHAILKPFLLRRLKVDVEKELPPKKEYLLYAPLTQQQKDIYQAIVSRTIRQYLVDKKTGAEDKPDEEVTEKETKPVVPMGRNGRKRAKVNYHIEENDSKYIRDLENGKVHEPTGVKEKSAAEVGKEWALKQASEYSVETGAISPCARFTVVQPFLVIKLHIRRKLTSAKSVNNMRLQNIVMQLRKVSSHPFLFDWPVDEETNSFVVNEDLVNASGKMLLLNRLLDALFDRGHKVLLFSQFTTMLDVIVSCASSRSSSLLHAVCQAGAAFATTC